MDVLLDGHVARREAQDSQDVFVRIG